MCCKYCNPRGEGGAMFIAEAFPKGFYLVIGPSRRIGVRRDTLRDIQKELFLFLIDHPKTEVYIAEIIPREHALDGRWDHTV